MNCSTLLHGRKSMQHLKAAIDGELRLSSSSLDFGKAVHCYLLEPDVFDAEYAVSGPCTAELASGQRKGKPCGSPGRARRDGEWVCGKHATDGDDYPANMVTAPEWGQIRSMASSLKRHKAVRLLRQQGGCEVSVIAELEGVLCKCRLDKWVPECKPYPNGVIVDVKTVSSGGGTEYAFRGSVDSYSYDVRAAFYVDCVEVVTGRRPEFVWVAVEKEVPYAVGVYEATTESLAWGRREYVSLLSALKQCRERERIANRLDEGDVWEDAVKNAGASHAVYRHLLNAKCGGNVERAASVVRDCWPGYTDNVQRLPATSWKVRQLAEAEA